MGLDNDIMEKEQTTADFAEAIRRLQKAKYEIHDQVEKASFLRENETKEMGQRVVNIR